MYLCLAENLAMIYKNFKFDSERQGEIETSATAGGASHITRKRERRAAPNDC